MLVFRESDRKRATQPHDAGIVRTLAELRSITLISKTNRDFFLPTTHFYRAWLNPNTGKDCFVIIVSPMMSWVLVTNEDYERDYKIEGGECVLRIAK